MKKVLKSKNIMYFNVCVYFFLIIIYSVWTGVNIVKIYSINYFFASGSFF